MQRTSTGTRKLPPFFNVNEAEQGEGGQINWSRLPADSFNVGKFTVKLAEAVSIGETSVDVDALLYPLKKGAVLDFGQVETVVVTFQAALINATTVGVTALTAPIPAGAILKTADSQEFVKLTADAALGATSLTVEAIPNALEGGETATYQGGDKILRLAADAAAGATNITVEAPEFAIADDSEAQADRTGDFDGRFIAAGTILSRLSDGTLIPRSITTASEPATEVLRSDAYEKSPVAAKSGYGTIRGGGLYENLLPDADGSGDVSETYKTELNTAGCNFWFTDWRDSRSE